MEARAVDAIPEGEQWQYEPKWDGFRCLVFRDRERSRLQSKSGEDLTRYFPEIAAAARRLGPSTFILDGELVVPQGDSFSFDALLQRIHPAESRVKRLATETPAIFIAFDLLAAPRRPGLADETLDVRRTMLEAFAERYLARTDTFRLSARTSDVRQAQRWLASAGRGCDGIVAKRRDLPYRAGLRDGMQKIKRYRSADCVIGGYRYGSSGSGKSMIASLLLGLYDEDDVLHHVGFSSAIRNTERQALTERLEKLRTETSFRGRTPGGPSRWSSERSTQWQPVEPKLVIEVCYDHASEGRFRHGTRIVRWRPDKRADQCRMDQLEQPAIDPRTLLSA